MLLVADAVVALTGLVLSSETPPILAEAGPCASCGSSHLSYACVIHYYKSMASPITLRLDPEIRRRVTRIARRRKTTTSSVLREAISTWVAREENTVSAYESIKDLIGIVHGDDPNLSTDMGKKFTQLLRARRNQS